MAKVVFNSSFDMENYPVWTGDVLSATATQMVISNGSYSSTYTGSFTYPSDAIVAGTITGFTLQLNGALLVTATGLTTNARTASDIVLAGGSQKDVFKYALNGADTFEGSAQRDTIQSFEGNDRISGLGGDDKIDGGTGSDTAVYQGARAQYTLTVSAGGVTVSDTVAARDGTDSLISIERVRFSDTTLAFDEGAGQVYRLYQAAFSCTPDKGGLSYWVDKMDHGLSLRDIVYGFINSGEFQKAYGNSLTNAQLVVQLYTNILGRAPEKDGADYWIGKLNEGASRLDVFASISESGENKDKLKAVIGQGIELETSALT